MKLPAGNFFYRDSFIFGPGMQFNSWEFGAFTACVLLAYWIFYKQRFLQNCILLLASYFFYGWMHPAFPAFLLGLTLIGFVGGQAIERTVSQKKLVLIFFIILSSLGLVILKYANFIISFFEKGPDTGFSILNFLIPVGLSFYTFSTIGYLVDIYRKRRPALKDPVTYGAYISFFPHLLAGPIPTSTGILPQFEKPRQISFQDIEDGAGQIVWGLFKKMVVADNIGLAVNYCFANADSLSSLSLYLGIVLFSFQIYADFSGYSEIARGVAKLLGIDLFPNFRVPFFSRNPGEFWRRWHISLMRWLSDYIYIPLGGKSGNRVQYIAILLFTFTFSGLWHGANLTFVLWGLLNGLYFLPYIFTGTLHKYREVVAAGRWLPSLNEFFQMLLVFHLITFSRILFKAKDLDQAGIYFQNLIGNFKGSAPGDFILTHIKWCLLLLIVEWIQRSKNYILDVPGHKILKWTVYIAIAVLIMLFHKKHSMQEYYYFRF